MNKLDASIKDTELKYTKQVKNFKQNKLKKIMNSNNANLPSSVNKMPVHKFNMNNKLKSLSHIFLNSDKATDNNHELFVIFKDGKAQLTSDSKKKVEYLKLIQILNFGKVTKIKTDIKNYHTPNNCCYISYKLHLNKNFFKAMRHIESKLNYTFKNQLCRSIWNSFYETETFRIKHPYKSISLYAGLFVLLSTFLGFKQAPYMRFHANLFQLISTSSLCGILVGLLVAMFLVFICLLGYIGLDSLAKHIRNNFDSKICSNKQLVINILAKYSDKSKAEVLSILTNPKL